MTRAILMVNVAAVRDRIMAWVMRRMEESDPLERFCWAVIIVAALYFSPALLQLVGVDITIADVVALVLAVF